MEGYLYPSRNSSRCRKREAGISGLKCRNFRWAGNLRREFTPTTSGTPPERDPRKDLVEKPTEISRDRNFRPKGRNFRPTGNFRGELPD